MQVANVLPYLASLLVVEISPEFVKDLKSFLLKIFRRPIEERVVTALGKHWHVEHFVCAKVAVHLTKTQRQKDRRIERQNNKLKHWLVKHFVCTKVGQLPESSLLGTKS